MHKCLAYTKSHSCYFYSNLERKKNDPAIKDVGILDIEDLVKLGQKQRVCPYFMARELKKDADIVFMPYNYILDQKHLKSHGVELTVRSLCPNSGEGCYSVVSSAYFTSKFVDDHNFYLRCLIASVFFI